MPGRYLVRRQRIAEVVVQHLISIVGAEVLVSIEVQAKLPDGFGDKLVGNVTENCGALRFSDFGFGQENGTGANGIKISRKSAPQLHLLHLRKMWPPVRMVVAEATNQQEATDG